MPLLLVLTLCLPLAGALVVSLLSGPAVRWAALLFACATLVAAAIVVFSFPVMQDEDLRFAEWSSTWVSSPTGIDLRFHVALDGISVWMFGLSALLIVTSILVSWDAVQERTSLFYSMLLLLASGCLGVFTAQDLILFYVFFEFTLIPLFFLIGIWGSEQRRYAAIKFFLFTLAGSVLTFLGLLAIVWSVFCTTGEWTFSIVELTESLKIVPISSQQQTVIFLALFAGFAIKVPLFPFHTWLPLAHVQAPAAGSVILAGILLKIGTYGFLRFNLPMLPEATALCMPWILVLSVAGILYGALVALAQSDMKRLIAYSSVSHLGFCMLGLFALNPLGLNGCVLQMVNHGISTGALFALVGMLYERYHTREIQEMQGLARRLPVLAFMLVLFTMSSIGLPGLNGFAGEILILVGMFQRGWADAPAGFQTVMTWIAVLAVGGVVLGAWYMLWLLQRILFGSLKEPSADAADHAELVTDLKLREILAVAPLAVFVVWIGVQPSFFLDRIQPSVRSVTDSVEASVDQVWRGPDRQASLPVMTLPGSRERTPDVEMFSGGPVSFVDGRYEETDDSFVLWNQR